MLVGEKSRSVETVEKEPPFDEYEKWVISYTKDLRLRTMTHATHPSSSG